MGRRREKAGGVDIHASILVAAIAWIKSLTEEPEYEVREFKNDASGQVELAKWFKRNKVTMIGMESTGPYWKALFFTLKQYGLGVKVANAMLIKNVLDAKTDILDAKWIARLTLLNLMPESNIPELDNMDYRSIVRSRCNCVKSKTRIKNQISGLIAEIGLRLKASDKFGKGCRKILVDLASGVKLPEIFSPSNCKRYGLDPTKGLALVTNLFTPTKKHILGGLLKSLERLEEQIGGIEAVIQELNDHPDRAELIRILRSMPGIDWVAASIILAEIGDISAFASAARLSSYAGVVPSSKQSGAKEIDGHIELKRQDGRPSWKCNHRLKWIILLCAERVILIRENDLNKHLKQFYKKILSRRTSKQNKMRARFALAHKMLKIIWTLLMKKEGYRGPGGEEKGIMPVRRRKMEQEDSDDEFVEVLSRISGIISGNTSTKVSSRVAG